MPNRDRFLDARFTRTLIVVAGVLGGLAALDAILLLPVLLLASSNPYIGLVTFVALPVAAVVGSALAWTAYTLLKGPARTVEAERRELGYSAGI